MRTVYWVSALAVLYVYLGYPLLLALWNRARALRRNRSTGPARPPGAAAGRLPSVSIVLAVRDEGRRLAARLNNLLALDYPSSRREIIVVSDGSTDNTAEVLDRYRQQVTAILLPAPAGKAAALNAGVDAASNELLVFADARQRFAIDALRHLTAPFADTAVGGVSGELLIDAEPKTGAEAESAVGEGVGLYWTYEKWLRQRESDLASTLGATGAIYALRRELWQPLPPGTVLDDVLAPMRAVLAGRRVLFAPAAKAYDRSADTETEMRRKVRTLAGNYQLLRLEPRLLVPFRNPVWLQFVSHKLGRLAVPYALVALLLANVALARESVFYALTLALQVGFYVLAAHGAALALAMPPRGAAANASPRPLIAAGVTGDGPNTGKGVDECAA